MCVGGMSALRMCVWGGEADREEACEEEGAVARVGGDAGEVREAHVVAEGVQQRDGAQLLLHY